MHISKDFLMIKKYIFVSTKTIRHRIQYSQKCSLTFTIVLPICFWFQAPNTWLHSYGPIKHEDGLETAILGLSFPVTEKSFLNQPGQLSLGLRCVSSIFTQNQKAHTVESKQLHTKDSKHFSYGSMLYSGKLQFPKIQLFHLDSRLHFSFK